MAHKRLSLTRGNSHTYGVTFKNSAGTPYNIKNWVLKFTLKTNWDLPDSDASLQKIITDNRIEEIKTKDFSAVKNADKYSVK